MSSNLERLFGLKGRVAPVTGSSGGVGEALAKGMAQAGAIVVVNGRAGEKVDAVAAEIAAAGGRAHRAVFDVPKSAEVRAGVARVEAEVGPIDILVNNAGIQRRAPLEEFPQETWREVMSANLDGVFLVGQAVARAMIERKPGRVTPLGRWGETEELVGAAIFLASDASSFVNGHILYVDGGITPSI